MLAYYSTLSVKRLDHAGNYDTEKPLIQLLPSNTEFQAFISVATVHYMWKTYNVKMLSCSSSFLQITSNITYKILNRCLNSVPALLVSKREDGELQTI